MGGFRGGGGRRDIEGFCVFYGFCFFNSIFDKVICWEWVERYGIGVLIKNVDCLELRVVRKF